ncbi:MAG: hypothetical protein AB1730_20850, partial [Myxococcota bacterium]
DKADKPRREKSGERAAPKREPRSTPPEPRAAPPAAAAAPAKKGGSSLLVWLVVPLLAVLGVGGYIAWDVYTEQLKAQQLQQEQEALEYAQPEEPEKSREVKVGPDSPPEAPAPPPEPEKTDKPKKKPVDRPKVAAASSPGAKALAALKADYAKLVDEGVAKKFKLKLHALEGEVGEKGDDPSYVSRVNALHEQVKAALESQQ